MVWEKIRGQDKQRQMFRRSLSRGRLSHAYLFVGPEGIGKRRFAESLAQCLFCERHADAELEACGECSNCRQMLSGNHADFISVGCPAGKSALPIEVFAGPKERRGREGLCYELSLRPMSGDRKIAVIDDGNLMNAESANALLKTLEEPPSYSLLIIIAASEEALLPTIRSRCQAVRFSPLSDADVAELLVEMEWVADFEKAKSIASLSDGSLATACQLLDSGIGTLRDLLFDSLATADVSGVEVAKRLIDGLDELGGDLAMQRRNVSWLLRFCTDFYQRGLHQMINAAAEGIDPLVDRFCDRLGVDKIGDLDRVSELIERVVLAEDQIDRKISIPLCLELLFTDLDRITRSACQAGA